MKILGIDLGTSSVKLICHDGRTSQKSRAEYSEISPTGWINAIISAAKDMDLHDVKAVGLSSQVGTYIINGEQVINWNDKVGGEELRQILNDISKDVFLREITMPHPKIISYPLPRLRYIFEHYECVRDVCMPKDYIIERMTGHRVTDKYSWRGLCNLQSGKYSEKLLGYIGVPSSVLPPVAPFDSIAGYITEEFSTVCGIPVGTPVVTGLNDFYASLLGMGMIRSGDGFDITGTSEHLGIVTNDNIYEDTPLVGGPFIVGNACYGVTASSGESVKFALRLDETVRQNDIGYEKDLPLFLPYLCGERAPVWDENATGAYIGITEKHDRRSLALSALEGVAMSIYHIYDTLGYPPINRLIVSGGAANIGVLNLMKASLFGCEVVTLSEPDTSALGAVICAALLFGGGLSPTVFDYVKTGEKILPNKHLTEYLRGRYDVYKRLYPALKAAYGEYNSIDKGDKK